MMRTLRGIGNRMIERIWRLGAGARLFFLTIIYSGESFRRFHLTLREVYFTGVMSLLIIVVSAFLSNSFRVSLSPMNNTMPMLGVLVCGTS